MYLQDLAQIRIGNEIGPALHGGNFVATANSADSNDPFFNVADALSIASIRFPGGDLTERHLSPAGGIWDTWVTSRHPTIDLPDGRPIATLISFLDRASTEGLEISFVLPTEGLLIRGADGSLSIDENALDKVNSLVYRMISGEYGALDIRQFEIGNEYYLDGRLSAAEYGFVANALVNSINSIFESHVASSESPFFLAPDIVVQAGPPWQVMDNQDIIASLDGGARSAIDGVIIHWYPRNLDQIGNLDRWFTSINEWERAEGFPSLDLHVTEWNVFVGPQADTGLYQASTLLEGYERLIAYNVDSADIWGVEFRRLITGLARPNQDNELGDDINNFILTPAGEIIRSLYQTTPGLSSLVLDPSDIIENSEEIGSQGENYTLTSFGDEDRAVLYFGSRSDHALEVNFDQGSYFSGAHYVVVQTFSTHDDVTTDENESAPEFAPFVEVRTSTYSQEQFANLSVDLDPGEIARVEYILAEIGVLIEGQVGFPINGISYSDHLLGTQYDDTLIGNQGNDFIDGGRGKDIVYGGSGADTLRGDSQSDLVDGGGGNDRLFGGANSDIVFGGLGSDTIHGGNQSDLIFGGEGINVLYGGDGNDTLISTGTNDTVAGGRGADLYSISTDEDTIIEGWSADEGDLISFQGQYLDPIEVRDRMVEVTYDDGRAGDLVIEHEGGVRTTLVGAAGHQDRVIASLFDFHSIGENTLRQADLLSSLTPSQVSALTGALNTEDYANYRQTIDPTLLAQNLDGERLGHFLNGLGQPDAYEFMNDIPQELRNDLLVVMQGPELNAFLSTLDYESMIAVLGSIGDSTFRELSSSFDDGTRQHVIEFLTRFSADYEEQHSTSAASGLSDISSLLTPSTEVGQDSQEPIPQEDNEEAENQKEVTPVAAGCFIATAVYADPDHPDVWLLRWFRDEVLRHFFLGRIFIVAYWHLGPFLAESISRSTFLVRVFLILFKMCVCLICVAFNRKVGRQPDHCDHPSSRLIKIGWASQRLRKKREAKLC